MNNLLGKRALCWITFALVTIQFAFGVEMSSSDDVEWSWTGFGGGGYFWCGTISPENHDVMYLGGDVGGIYKTTDRGKNWRFVNKGLHNYGVYGIAVAPSDAKVLYVMTVDGMARSVDGGESWEEIKGTGKASLDISISRGRDNTVRPISVHPSKPSTVFAGSRKGQLFSSVDGGENWRMHNYHEDSIGGGSAGKPKGGDGYLVMEFSSGAADWNKGGRVERYYEEFQN